MAIPAIAAVARRQFPVLTKLRRPISHLSSLSPSDSSDFEPDPDEPYPPPPLSGAGDISAGEEVHDFLKLLSSAKSLAATRKEALSLLTSSSAVEPTTELLLRALWEVRHDPEAAVLALRWGEERLAAVAAYSAAWHLAIWAAGKKGRFDVAWGLVRLMYRKAALTPRAMVIMMERYAAANEVDKAIKTFNVMEKFKVDADQTVFHALLRALCKNKNIEEAEELLLVKKKFFPLSVEGFNIILEGWCNIMADVVEAKRVWREMSNCCITPDGTSYEHMISCFSKVGNLFDSLRLYDEMKKRGWTPGLVAYNSLVYVLTRENCLKDAQNIFSKITDAGLQPDVETYNAMICPLCDSHKLDEARMVMEDMMVKGISPNITTYHAFLNEEGIDETLKLLRKMKEVDCGPNSYTFLLLINKFFRLNESENALRMWTEMRKYDINPNSSHYMSLVHGLVKHGWIPRALEFYNEMKDKGFASDPGLEKEFKAFLLANKDHWSGVGKQYIVPRYRKHLTMRGPRVR